MSEELYVVIYKDSGTEAGWRPYPLLFTDVDAILGAMQETQRVWPEIPHAVARLVILPEAPK